MYITYQLVIRIKNEVTIAIGKFGVFTFPAGIYTYTGSAKKNYEARIARHLSKNKKLKWHIDYLLADSNVDVLEVLRTDVPECTFNQQTKGTPLITGFGSSDCKHNCGSHLLKRD